MSALLAILAALLVPATAVRSTWSPCGLSMLSSITPVSERGRGNTYRATAAWYIVGAMVGGATLGGVAAAGALGVAALDLPDVTVTVLAVAAALLVAASDAGIAGFRLPFHRRQVNERWLDQYRAWVYGAGFGWQIGSGLATYITNAGIYLMVALAALSGRPFAALGVGTAFGILRGLAVLLTRRVASPAELLGFHRRFTSRGPAAAQALVVVELLVVAALAVAAAAGGGGAAVAAGVAAGISVTVVCISALARRSRREPAGGPRRTLPAD